MPSQELGAPAVKKFDMETWLPARKFWGEVRTIGELCRPSHGRVSVFDVVTFCHCFQSLCVCVFEDT